MESGARPELNAQRYAVVEGIITTTGGDSGKVNPECCESGNFGTRLSYERIS